MFRSAMKCQLSQWRILGLGGGGGGIEFLDVLRFYWDIYKF